MDLEVQMNRRSYGGQGIHDSINAINTQYQELRKKWNAQKVEIEDLKARLKKLTDLHGEEIEPN